MISLAKTHHHVNSDKTSDINKILRNKLIIATCVAFSTIIYYENNAIAQPSSEEASAVDTFFGRLTCETDATLICQESCRRLSKAEAASRSPLEIDVLRRKVFLGAKRVEADARLGTRVGLTPGRLVMLDIELSVSGRAAVITLSANSPEDTARDGAMTVELKPGDNRGKFVHVLTCKPLR